MHLESDGCVPAGDVLGDQVAANFFCDGASDVERGVDGCGFEEGISSGGEIEVASGRVAEERTIFQDVNVYEWNVGAVGCRIGDVYFGVDGERCFRGVADV